MPLDDVGPQGTTGTVEFQVGDADSSGIDLTPNLVGQAVLQGRSQAANDGTSVLVNQSGTQIDEFFTPEDGSFSFRLQAGSYSLKATRLGWLRVTRDITIVAGQTVDTARMRLRAGDDDVDARDLRLFQFNVVVGMGQRDALTEIATETDVNNDGITDIIDLAFGALNFTLPVAGPPPTGLYLALGDSLAVGVGGTDPAIDGYVPKFHQFLLSKRQRLVRTNLGKTGDTSSTFVSGGQLNAAASDTRVVPLDVGGNDVLDLIGSGQPCELNPGSSNCQQAIASALAAFTPKYQEIMTAITIALTGDPGEEDLLVMAYFNPFEGTGSVHEAPVGPRHDGH